jgi:hypothetical protein
LWNVLATFQTMYSENVSNYGVMAGLIVWRPKETTLKGATLIRR